MRFDWTPEEAQGVARTLIRHFKRQRMRVRIETAAWPEAPYRTTVVAERAGRHVLVEAQGTLGYGRSLKELVAWIDTRRHYAELYIATKEESVLQAGVLQDMKVDGVGLLVVNDEGVVSEHQRARNPALVVTPDPTLRFGPSRDDVRASVKKFNEVDRKDGLRDMCEVVERLTEELGVTACRRGWLKTPEANFVAKDWAGQINELARPEVYNLPRSPLFATGLKDDLHSFRGARNLIDHKVRSRREDTRRQKQFAERMMQGPRLVAELVSLKRRVR